MFSNMTPELKNAYQIIQELKQLKGETIFESKNAKICVYALRDLFQGELRYQELKGASFTLFCKVMYAAIKTDAYGSFTRARDNRNLITFDEYVKRLFDEYGYDRDLNAVVLELLARLTGYVDVFSKSYDNDNIPVLYGAVRPHVLKTYWLIPTSHSMRIDGKMTALNRAMRATISELRECAEDYPEIEVLVSVVSYSTGAKWVVKDKKIDDFEWQDLFAIEHSKRDIGSALKLISEELIERMGDKVMPPAIILISDGGATDDFESGINILREQKWGKRSERIAIPIGVDANYNELVKFTKNESRVVKSGSEKQIIKYIDFYDYHVCMYCGNVCIICSCKIEKNRPLPLPPITITIGDGDADVFW